MFMDRAQQFKVRQGWDVSLNDHGEERDEYDQENPLYVIWQKPNGMHGGSMRLLPTMGQTMVNDHFLHLLAGTPLRNPLIWECTRFCLAADPAPTVAAAPMLAGGDVMSGHGIKNFVGVFDAPMVRIYRSIGSSPLLLGHQGEGRNRIAVGLWELDDISRVRVAARAGLSQDISTHWYRRAFSVYESEIYAA